ncbi:transposase [Intrasporangium sp.]|uniref:IS701 family transposase n=1 Tax=Intrasporangium sp. TaxID=1925024 RepID=UPI0032214121
MTGFLALLGLTRAGFTAPSFAIFTDLLTGWVCAPGRRTIIAMITGADPAGRRAHDAYHRFVRDGAWSMSWLWQVLTVHLVGRLVPTGVDELACDDTLFHHEGRHVEGAGTFRDAVRSTAKRVVYERGLNLVVITLQVRPPWGGCPIAVPVNARVHRKKDTTTTIGHAEAMLRQIAGWLPNRELHLCADGAYATLARDLPSGVQLTCRMRRDAALYQAAPPRTGKRGRPRTKGDRLPTPAQLSKTLPARVFTGEQVDVRGATVTTLVHVTDVLWYAVNKTSLVRLVIVRDPDGKQPDDYFFTTDLHAAAASIITRYAARWAIEVCFRDTKQDLGAQNPQSWKRRGPERAAALSLWLHAATWCWYLCAHPDGRTWTPRPWYRHKATPSFLDALAALRKALWSQRITAMSRSEPDNTKITEAILDTLAYAA